MKQGVLEIKGKSIMDTTKLKRIVEGALLAADQPLSVDQLERLFVEGEERPSRDELREALKALESDCEERGYELKQVASGYRFQVRQDYSDWVGRLWEEKPPRYSRATLETLALIAYRQPITRAEIEEIRGVSVSSNIVKSLTERDWIRVVGHKEVPGKPAMYGTTRGFLDYFNLKSLDELPTLAELRDLDQLHPELGLDNPDMPQDQAKPTGETDQTDAEGVAEAEGDAADDRDDVQPEVNVETDVESPPGLESPEDDEPTDQVAPVDDVADAVSGAVEDEEGSVEGASPDEDESESTLH